MCFTNFNDIYENEKIYRKSIMKKIRNGEKIGNDEREWLVTHSLYNPLYDSVVFNSSVEYVEPNKEYIIEIEIESVSYDKYIVPIVSIPAGKGSLHADFEVKDIDGKSAPTGNVKSIGIVFSQIPTKVPLAFLSEKGVLSVAYECDYYDEKQKLNLRQASSTGCTDFGILREIVDKNTVRYRCKSPQKSNFDALVFCIHFNKKSF